MSVSEEVWQNIEQLIAEMTQSQKEQILKCAKRIVPHVTPEDLLQPNDYPALENHPYFRYEEGMLAGLQSVQMAIWALRKAFNTK